MQGQAVTCRLKAMTIKEKFKELRRVNKKAFITYVPYGFPGIKHTRDILIALQEAGADIIELGLPFSDPLADGPIIQKAATQAIKNGANTDNLFAMLAEIKDVIKVPLVVMTYYNPVFRFGMERFFSMLSRCGVSGIMIVDAPLEESGNYTKIARKHGLETVFFITPTTLQDRAGVIIKSSRGFVYYISVTGITGPRILSYKSLSAHIKQLKSITDLPVCVGFGIHTREQVAMLNGFSDGVIIGSAIVKFIEKNHADRDFLSSLKRYVKSLIPVDKTKTTPCTK